MRLYLETVNAGTILILIPESVHDGEKLDDLERRLTAHKPAAVFDSNRQLAKTGDLAIYLRTKKAK